MGIKFHATGPHDVHLHPALKGGPVGLISAENPAFQEAATHFGHEALARELDRLGYDYEPTRGAYGAKERSYIIHNPRIHDLLSLGQKFGQEAVVYSQNGRHWGLYTNGNHVGMYSPGEGHRFSETEPANFFTALPTPNGDTGYFSYNIDWDTKMPFKHEEVGPAALPVPPAPEQPSVETAQRVAGDPNGGMQKSISAPEAATRLLKAVVESYHEGLLELRKKELSKGMYGAPATAAAGRQQASFDATRQPAAAIPKAVAKPHSAYDANAFKPTGPIHSGLELDTKKEEVMPNCSKSECAGGCKCAKKTEVASAKTKAANGGQVVEKGEFGRKFAAAATGAALAFGAGAPSARAAEPRFPDSSLGVKRDVALPTQGAANNLPVYRGESAKAVPNGTGAALPHAPMTQGVPPKVPAKPTVAMKGEMPAGNGKEVVPSVAAGKTPKDVSAGSEQNINDGGQGGPIEGGAKLGKHPQGFKGSPLLDLMRDQAAKATKAKGGAVVEAVPAGKLPGDVTAGKELGKDELRINRAAVGGGVRPGSTAAQHPGTRHLKNEIPAGQVPAQGGQIAPGGSAGRHPATASLSKGGPVVNGEQFAPGYTPEAATYEQWTRPTPTAAFNPAQWAQSAPACRTCGTQFQNPVQVLLSGDHGNCGKCVRGAQAQPGAPVVKQEMMIDLKNTNDPKKRIKDVNPQKGTKVPGGKETGWSEDGDKSKEVSHEADGKVKKGSLGKAAMPAGAAPAAMPKPAAPAKVPSAKPAGIPGAPKAPKAPGAV